MRKIILASQSPRRKELMALLPYPFSVQTKEVEEVIDGTLSPKENVVSLAYQKAVAMSKVEEAAWVIGCDTIVVCDDEIMGKPKNEEDAKKMLTKLSGRKHFVYTGVCLLQQQTKMKINFVVDSEVTMKKLTEEMIAWYVNTKEPLDKAGSYGIQGHGALLVQEIKGDYFNIVGLPVSRLYDELRKVL